MSKRMMTVEMTDVFLGEIDGTVVDFGFTSRSEFVKTAIRFYIHKLKEEQRPGAIK